MKRIVITGLGAMTPVGNDPESFWSSLVAGRSGAGPVTLFDPQDMPFNIACEVKDFDVQAYMDRKLARRTARSTQFAIAAGKQALADSGLTIAVQKGDSVTYRARFTGFTKDQAYGACGEIKRQNTGCYVLAPAS